jgi:hypothetical protein
MGYDNDREIVMTVSKKLVFWQAVVITRRAERARRRRLEREIAAYSSPADRRELEAILNRHTAAESRQVWAILNRQAVSNTGHSGPRRTGVPDRDPRPSRTLEEPHMTRTLSSLARSALAGLWSVLPRLADSWTIARVNPDLPARLLSRGICTDVVPGLPDTRLLVASRPNTGNHRGDGRGPTSPPAKP